jgi:hypothetical protein
MALTLATETTEALSLDEYLERVASTVDLDDEDSIIASAPLLRGLANNRRVVGEFLTEELRGWREFQPTNAYSAPTLLLATRDRFSVRANVWEPPAATAELQDHQRALYFYEKPHDHNFSFLTVGYFGPGYETVIYERDPEALTGVVGEKVELRFLERTTLPQGKVMYYRAGRDIHSQGFPRSLSLSINLLVRQPAWQRRDQYFFDLEAGTVSGVGSGGVAASRLMPCRLAAHFGDGHTAEVLESLALAHPVPRIRMTAFESLATLAGAQARTIWRRAEADPHLLVRLRARQALGALDGG